MFRKITAFEIILFDKTLKTEPFYSIIIPKTDTI